MSLRSFGAYIRSEVLAPDHVGAPVDFFQEELILRQEKRFIRAIREILMADALGRS